MILAVKLVLIAADIDYEDYEVDEIPYPDVTDEFEAFFVA